MSTKLDRRQIADEVYLSILQDPKFKHNRISINLIVPLTEEAVSKNAMLSLLMRKGSKSCDDFTQLNRRLDMLYGASFGTDVSKCEGNQIITIGVKSVDDRYTMGDEKLTLELSNLLMEILFEPLIFDGEFRANEWELEKRFLVDTIEAQVNDKRSYAVHQCRKLMGRNHPSSLSKYGTLDGAKALENSIVAKEYSTLIDLARVEIFFTGSGDPSQAIEIFENAFSQLKRNPVESVKLNAFTPLEQPLEQTDMLDVAQSKMVLGFRTPQRGDREYRSAMRVMTALYGGTPSSKLFLNVREKLSLCYYCAARYDPAAAIVMVDCGVEQKNIQSARVEILNQLKDIQESNFEDETLENTKLQLKNSLRGVTDYPASLEEWYLTRILSGEIYSPQEEISLIDSITREQVVAAANSISLDAVYILTSKEGEKIGK